MTLSANEAFGAFQETKESLTRETVLRQLIQTVHSTLDLEDIFQQLVQQLGTFLQADQCFIALYDQVSEKLQPPTREYRISKDIPSALILEEPFWQESRQGIIQQICHDKTMMVFTQQANQLAGDIKAYMQYFQVKSGVGCPILFQGNCIAVLFVHQLTNLRQWSETDKKMIEEAAVQVGVAIHQSQLFAQVAQAEARFQSLKNANIVGIIIADSAGKIIDANESFTRMVGYSREELLSNTITWHQLTPSQYIFRDEQAIRELRQKGIFQLYEKQYIRKDGSLVDALLGGAALDDSDFLHIAFILDITDQKRTEKSLKESQERFRLLVDAVTDYAIYLEDPQGRITSWNDGAKRIFGYQAEDVIGKPFSIFLPEADLASGLFERELDAAERDGRFEVEGYRIRKDGSSFWANVVITALRDEEGKLVGYSSITRDITERKTLEQELQASNERFQLVSEGSNDGFWDWEIAQDSLYLSAHFWEMLGLKSGKTSYERFLRLVHPDDRPLIEQAVQAHLEQGQPYHVEFRLRRASGEYFYCVSRGKAIWNDLGRPIRMAGAVTDITIRKKYELALVESEKRFRLLTNAVPFLIAIADEGKQMNFFNDAWKSYTGRSMEGLLGEGWLQDVHPEDIAAVVNAYQRVYDTQDEQRIEFRICRNDGQFRWFSAVCTPTYQPDSQFAGTVVTCYDVNDIKEAANLALEATERKSLFLANMSHELRTPLNAIIGYSEMLYKGMAVGKPEKERQYLQNICQSGYNILEMVNSILDLAKIEAGKIELVYEHVLLQPLISELQEMFQTMAESKGITLTFYIQPGLDEIYADPQRLRQIFVNLLSNAVKYNREGGQVHLQMTLSEDAHWFFCAIQDTGIGIPADKLTHIFQEFYQVDNSYARRQEGTGLGLALTKKLVELHHGEIWLDSKEGVGSTFTFKLPVQ